MGFPTDVKEQKSGAQYIKDETKRKRCFFVLQRFFSDKGSDHFSSNCDIICAHSVYRGYWVC